MLRKIAGAYLNKKADYSDTLVHDFYGNYYNAKNDELFQYKDYFNALNKFFKNVLKGNHGQGYEGRGLHEKDKVSDILIDIHNEGLLPYNRWAQQAKKHIDEGNLEKADSFTWPASYYVKTHGTITPDTITDVSSDPSVLKLLYSKDANLSLILNRLREHKRQGQDIKKLDKELNLISKPFIKQLNEIDRDQTKALSSLRKQIDALDDKRYALWDVYGVDSPEEQEIDKQLEILYKAERDQNEPFALKTDKVLEAMNKATDPLRSLIERKRLESQQALNAPF